MRFRSMICSTLILEKTIFENRVEVKRYSQILICTIALKSHAKVISLINVNIKKTSTTVTKATNETKTTFKFDIIVTEFIHTSYFRVRNRPDAHRTLDLCARACACVICGRVNQANNKQPKLTSLNNKLPSNCTHPPSSQSPRPPLVTSGLTSPV